MVSTNMHTFKHPKYYKELRKRNKAARIPPTSSGQAASDQAISLRAHDGERERAPDSGLKPKSYVWYFHNHKWKQRYDPSAKQQATSSKPHAPIFRKRQAR